MANGFFLFHFRSEEGALETLTGGPWLIQGGPLSLIPWRPDFQALRQTINSAPVWVRLPGLPFKYWNVESLAAIAAEAGKPLRVDEQSLNLERGSYIRVCVELDLAKPVPEGVWIGQPGAAFFQIFSYENLPSICTSCGCIGHILKECPQASAQDSPPPSSQTPAATAGVTSRVKDGVLPTVGPWLRVQRRKN